MTFKEGDRVRVTRKGVTSDPNGMGPGKRWDNIWIEDMDAVVGKEFVIGSISERDVHFEDDGLYGYGYPLNILELVSAASFVLEPNMLVETRNGQKWRVVPVTGTSAAEPEHRPNPHPHLALAYNLGNGCYGWNRAYFTAPHDGTEAYEIVRVFAAPKSPQYLLGTQAEVNHGDLLWEAEELTKAAAQAREVKRQQLLADIEEARSNLGDLELELATLDD